jgi:hypothetical protein
VPDDVIVQEIAVEVADHLVNRLVQLVFSEPMKFGSVQFTSVWPERPEARRGLPGQNLAPNPTQHCGDRLPPPEGAPDVR